ncbi:MAG: flippase [bacterium]
MIKDSLYTLLTRVLFIIGKLAYSVIVNRTLGPEGKGLFELIQLAPNTLTNFGAFGFNEANTYFTGKRPELIQKIIGNSWRLTVGFSILAIILGIGFFLLPVNQGMFTTLPMWVGFLALAVIPIALLDLFLEGILYGENRIWVRNWHEIIRISSGILFMGVLVFVLKMYVTGAVYGFIMVNAALLIFIFIVLNRFHGIKIPASDFTLARTCWKFARFSWGANFATYLLYNSDKWMIFLLAPKETRMEQVGLYTTAVSVIVNIWIIPGAIQTALLPKITKKGESERKKLVPPSLRAVTIMVLLAMGLLALIGKPALDILYNRKGADWDFTEAYIPLMLLMPGIFTMSLAKVFAADFFSRGKPQFNMWVSIFSLVVNVILNIALIPKYGMNGAAIASSIAYTISFLVFLYLYIRESGERSRDIFIPKRSDFEFAWQWIKSALVKPNKNSDKGDKQ